MVKNKATAKLCCIFLVWSLSFFLSLSLADLALSRPVLHVSVSPTPFILRVPLDPARVGPRHHSPVSQALPHTCYSLLPISEGFICLQDGFLNRHL